MRKCTNLHFGIALALIATCVTAQVQQPERNCSLSGHIVDPRSGPVAAKVTVYHRMIVEGRVDLAAFCIADTDAEGRYDCKALISGDYFVSAIGRASPQEGMRHAQQRVYPLTFYPSANHPGEAEKVSLREAEHGVADITLKSSRPATLHVKVEGAPKNVSFLFRAHGGGFDLPVESPTVYDAASAVYTITLVPEGTYSLSAAWFAGRERHGQSIVEVSGDSDQQVLIKETEQVALQGEVKARGQSPSTLPGKIFLEARIDGFVKRYSGSVKPDGSFFLPSVDAGTYRLHFGDMSSTYVLSASASGKEVNPRHLRLPLEGSVNQLTLEIGTSSVDVSGVLDTSDETIRGAGVVLEDIDDGTIVTAQSDRNGRFTLQGIQPGEYRLFGFGNLQATEYRNAAYLQSLRRKSTEITIDGKNDVSGLHLTAIKNDD